MIREDLIGITRAPRSVEELLVQLAGRNPYGEPNYRVVLAQHRVCKQAAEWHDWRKELTVQERGGIVQDDEGRMVASPNKPLRVVKEMRTILRYPICECPEGVLTNKATGKREEAGDCEECSGVRGWIIEKWWPAHVVAGDPKAWYASKVPGTDLPRLGPYPETGAYRRIAISEATARVPSQSQLAQLVIWLENRKNSSSLTPEQYAREYVIAAEYEKQRADRADRERMNEIMRDSLDPLVGSSLAAGRAREQIANRLRARGIPVGHVGA